MTKIAQRRSDVIRPYFADNTSLFEYDLAAAVFVEGWATRNMGFRRFIDSDKDENELPNSTQNQTEEMFLVAKSGANAYWLKLRKS